jgi:hypothetical protein
MFVFHSQISYKTIYVLIQYTCILKNNVSIVHQCGIYIAKFKTELKKQKDISQVPKHYEIGPRKLNIALT